MKIKANWRFRALGLSLAAMIGVAFWMRALASWRPQKVAIVAPASAHALQISPDGRFLMAGFREFHDLEGEKRVPSVPTGEGFYGFSPEGTYFSTDYLFGQAARRIKILRRAIQTGEVAWSALDSPLKGDGYTLTITQSGDEEQVLVRSQGQLRAFDAHNGTLEWRRAGRRLEGGTFVKNGRFLWANNTAGCFLSETTTGRILWRKFALNSGDSSGISPDESLVWMVSAFALGKHFDTVARFYDLKSGKLLWKRRLAGFAPADIHAPLTFSSDGRHVAFMNWTGVEWFDAQTGKRMGSRRGPGHNVAEAMAFSHDGDFLYTCDKNGQIWKWRLK